MQTSPDDNVLVTGVSGEENALGYFGFSFYEQNMDKLNLVSVDGGGGCVAPSTKSIQDGSYKPLSRPLFMYPSTKAIAKPEVKAFMDFVIKNQDKIVEGSQDRAYDVRAGHAVPAGPDQGRAGLRQAPKRMEATSAGAMGPGGPGPVPAPDPSLHRGGGHPLPAPRRGADLDPHHHGDRHLAARGDRRLLRRGRRRRLLLRHEVDPAVRRRSQSFGVVPLVYDTLYLTGIGLLVAVPFGIGSAIYLSEYATPRVRKTLKPDPRGPLGRARRSSSATSR